MRRLIDADDVISLLANHHFDDSKENTDLLIHNLYKEVKSVPTAYDVDAVVKQLEELTEEECTLHECGIRSERCKPCIAKKAIEIVKGGGVDG